MRRIGAALLVLALFAGCSSNDLAEQGERSRAGKQKNGAGAKGNNKGPASVAKEKAEQAEEEIGATDAPGGGAAAPSDFGGKDAPSSGIDPSLARVGTAMDDSPSDAKKQGLAPDHTEITRASIQGLGDTVRFTLRFNGNLPNQVAKNQYMVVAFGITGDKEGKGFAMGATCDEKGWHPYAGSKGDATKFPGTFEIQGTEIVMEVDWSFVQGPRAFEWYASTGWYNQIANQTHWSFDSIPNGKAGKFPG